jgi:hypothetical protein
MLDWISAVGDVWPSITPEEVLQMDALYSVELCAAFVRRRKAAGKGNAGGGGQPGGWESRPDGSKVMRITSMQGLRDFLGGQPKANAKTE